MKNKFITKNKIIILILIVIAFFGILAYIQYPQQPELKVEESAKISDEDLDNYLNKVYSMNKIFFIEKTKEYRTQLVELRDNEIQYEKYEDNDSKRVPSCKVADFNFTNNTDTNLSDVIVSIKNNGNKNITSVKLKLYYFSGNSLIKSEDLQKDIYVPIGQIKNITLILQK